jgi:hypothetical protein
MIDTSSVLVFCWVVLSVCVGAILAARNGLQMYQGAAIGGVLSIVSIIALLLCIDLVGKLRKKFRR